MLSGVLGQCPHLKACNHYGTRMMLLPWWRYTTWLRKWKSSHPRRSFEKARKILEVVRKILEILAKNFCCLKCLKTLWLGLFTASLLIASHDVYVLHRPFCHKGCGSTHHWRDIYGSTFIHLCPHIPTHTLFLLLPSS